MDSYLMENFGDVKAKNSSEGALQRWRRACWLLKNPKLRFRFTANLSMRSEADVIHHMFKTYYRVAVIVSQAAIQFIQGLSDYEVPEDVEAAGYQSCAEELESVVEGHDEKKLRSHGGVEGIADKLSASEVTAGPSDYKLPEDVEAAGYQSCAEELESVVEGHDEKKLRSHGGVEGIADKLSASEVTAGPSDYKLPEDVEAAGYQSCAEELESIVEGHDEKKPVIRKGFRQKLFTHDLLPGDIVLLNIGDQVPADGLFITGGSLSINLSSLTADSKHVHASGVGIPFRLPGKEDQYLITQDACDPCSNDSAYASDDLIHLLVCDLNSCCLDKQKQAALKIRRLTKNKHENCIRIAQAGAIEPLIILISSYDPEVQEYSVTAILNLSLCDENKKLIVASGAIKPLVGALREGTPMAKENAVCALLHLSLIEENKVAIGRSGAIPLLVDLLESGGWRGKGDACLALYSLCSAQENEGRAVQAGAMGPLVRLMEDLGSSVVDKAAIVVSRLVGWVGAGAALVEEGGIPVLVELVDVGTQTQKEIAVGVLLQLCEESVEYRTKVRLAGAVPLMVLAQSGANPGNQTAKKLLKLLGQSNDDAEDYKVGVRLTRNGDGVLNTGSSLDTNESSLTGESKSVPVSDRSPSLLSERKVQDGIMQDASKDSRSESSCLPIACDSDIDIHELVHNLESGCLDLQKQAAHQISLLTKNEPENLVRIAQAGAIKPLITLISSSDPQAQEYSVTAIHNLSVCHENRELIVESGAIEPLVRILSMEIPKTKENAASTLDHLSRIANNKVAIGCLGAIPPLVSLLKSGESRGKDALRALYSLCSENENKVRAVEAGAMRPLVEQMVDLGSSRVPSVVSRLVGSAEAREALVKEGGIPVLVKMVEAGTQRQKEFTVEALSQLCEESVKLVQAGAMRPLVELMADLGSSIGDKAAVIVSMLVGAAEAREALVKEGGIPVLVKMVEEGTQRQKEIAVVVLFQLCEESVACRTTVVQAGAMSPLVELMVDLGSSIGDKAAVMVSMLVGAAEAREALVKEGGIPVLVKMVEKGTQRQKEIAVGVLLQLCEDSVEYRTEVVVAGAVPIMALARSGANPGNQEAKKMLKLLGQSRSGDAAVGTSEVST